MHPESWFYIVPLRLRSLFRRSAIEQELDEELRDHIKRQTDENVARGMSPEVAHRAALIALGGLEQRKEQCRDVWGVNWIEDLARDLSYGWRMMRQNPAFTAVALLTLALGIGANTAIFSTDNALLFRLLPYQDSGRLVQVFQKYLPTPAIDRMPVAPANYLDWQRDDKSFEGFAAYRLANFNLSGNNNPERIRAAQTSANTFTLLGVAPMLGRAFQSGEDAVGSGSVAILSHGLWQRRFGADQAILGKTVRANNRSYTIIGVMPPSFRFPIGWLSGEVEIWTPLILNTSEQNSRKDIMLDVIARLRPSVNLKQAQANLDVVTRQLAQAYPDTNKDWGTNIMPLAERGVSDIRGLLVFLSLAVGLVLLIACANVANLLLARGMERQKELTVRTALGAQRSRVVRQLLAEGVLLSTFGGLIGIALAYWGIDALSALAPTSDAPELKHVALNGRVLAFSLGLSILTGFLFSLFPALTVSSFSLHGTLQEGGRSNTGSIRRNRLKAGLVVGELALTLSLVLCATSVLKSFRSYMAVDPGFVAKNVLTMRMVLPTEKYKQPQQWATFFERVVEEIKTIPGLVATAVGSGAPMEGEGSVFKYNIAGKPAAGVTESRVMAEYFRVSSEYFRVTGIQLRRGRYLQATDGEGTPPVAVVSEEFVKREFAGVDPIGQRIILRGDVNQSVGGESGRPPLEIIGVVTDTREYGLYHKAQPMIYVPMSQDPQPAMALLIKSAGDSGSLLPEIRRRLLKLDADQPVYKVRTLEDIVGENLALFKFNTLLLTVFAAIALLLSLIGIYGVIAYAVGQRTKEFSIRLALGSRPREILRLALKQGAWLSMLGVSLGLALSWPAIKLMARSLKQSMYLDLIGAGPALFVTVSGAVALVMLLVCLIPARRATHTDPMVALRCE